MNRLWLKLASLICVFLLISAGLSEMGFFKSTKSELKRLLGEGGSDLIEDAEVVAWGLDPDHKPNAYYALRSIDEEGFRELVARNGFGVAPIPTFAEAIWTLPEGLKLSGWTAPSVLAGAGLQAQGAISDANVWLRWHEGLLFIVALRAS